MAESRLNIVQADNKSGKSETYAGGKSRRNEAQAHFDRLWLVDAESMDPLRNCMERERLDRTLQLIQSFVKLDGSRVADLGCGSGVISRMIRDSGAKVDAVDISGMALKKLGEKDVKNIQAIQDYVPVTTLKDDTYDLVVCTELIADLQPNEFRLLISELARLVKPEGHIVCSTALDINSEDALQKFKELAETELQINQWVVSYHRLYIRIKDFFEAPLRFYKASRDPEYRHRQVNQRVSLSKTWFSLNSHKIPGLLWGAVSFLCRPFVYILRQNRGILLMLERFCRFFWAQAGISHAMYIGKRRPLFVQLPPNEIPRETKHKKQMWE